MTCHWSFIQLRPEPGGHLRLLARVEQSPGAGFEVVGQAGEEAKVGGGAGLEGKGQDCQQQDPGEGGEA